MSESVMIKPLMCLRGVLSSWLVSVLLLTVLPVSATPNKSTNSSMPNSAVADIPFVRPDALALAMESKTCEIVTIYADSEVANDDKLLALVWFDLGQQGQQEMPQDYDYDELSYWPALYMSVAGVQHRLLQRSDPVQVRSRTLATTELRWADQQVAVILQLDAPRYWAGTQDGTPQALPTAVANTAANVATIPLVTWRGTLVLQTASQRTNYPVLVESICSD